MTVYAYIGLAYYDGNNDGRFNDIGPTQFPGGTPTLVADMINNPANYINLYQNNNEIGNLVRTQKPVILDGSYITGSECAILGNNVGIHLPTDPNQLSTGGPPNNAVNPSLKYFDISHVTQDEYNLLQKYGKVFYYEVIIEDANGTVLLNDFMHPEISTLHTGTNPWELIVDPISSAPIQSFFPPMGSVDLYFYHNQSNPITFWDISNPTNSRCDSREIVMDIPNNFNYRLFGGTIPQKSVSLLFRQGTTLWQGSSLWLDLQP